MSGCRVRLLVLATCVMVAGAVSPLQSAAGSATAGSAAADASARTVTDVAQRTVVQDWASISAGYDHTCGVRTDGTAWCWGWNSDGQLGDGTTTKRKSPVRVGTANNWDSISAGNYDHTCGVRTNGTAWCWGQNGYGQLGDGTTTKRLSPVQVVPTSGLSVK